MSRDFVINGECLVRVKGGAHLALLPGGDLSYIEGLFSGDPKPAELGLSDDQIRVSPRYVHRDMLTDDFGPEIPADVQWLLAEAYIHMTLVHYDRPILAVCMKEAMGGGRTAATIAEGAFAGAGTPLGAGKQMFASGNHLMSLTLSSQMLNYPWRFKSCYLNGNPLEVPIGNQRTIARVTWRAIPYTVPVSQSYTEIRSNEATLWDHTLDT